MDDLKKQIIDAAKTLASTPESDAHGTPDVMRYKIHALIEACENLIRDNAEVVKWVKVADDLPLADTPVLVVCGHPSSNSTDVFEAFLCSEKGGWACSDGCIAQRVRYWAAMPAGPKQ